jgi:hypothetical protein
MDNFLSVYDLVKRAVDEFCDIDPKSSDAKAKQYGAWNDDEYQKVLTYYHLSIMGAIDSIFIYLLITVYIPNSKTISLDVFLRACAHYGYDFVQWGYLSQETRILPTRKQYVQPYVFWYSCIVNVRTVCGKLYKGICEQKREKYDHNEHVERANDGDHEGILRRTLKSERYRERS